MGIWLSQGGGGGGGSCGVDVTDLTTLVSDSTQLIFSGSDFVITDQGGGDALVEALGGGSGGIDVGDGTSLFTVDTIQFQDNLLVTNLGGGAVRIDGQAGGAVGDFISKVSDDTVTASTHWQGTEAISFGAFDPDTLIGDGFSISYDPSGVKGVTFADAFQFVDTTGNVIGEFTANPGLNILTGSLFRDGEEVPHKGFELYTGQGFPDSTSITDQIVGDQYIDLDGGNVYKWVGAVEGDAYGSNLFQTLPNVAYFTYYDSTSFEIEFAFDNNEFTYWEGLYSDQGQPFHGVLAVYSGAQPGQIPFSINTVRIKQMLDYGFKTIQVAGTDNFADITDFGVFVLDNTADWQEVNFTNPDQTFNAWIIIVYDVYQLDANPIRIFEIEGYSKEAEHTWSPKGAISGSSIFWERAGTSDSIHPLSDSDELELRNGLNVSDGTSIFEESVTINSNVFIDSQILKIGDDQDYPQLILGGHGSAITKLEANNANIYLTSGGSAGIGVNETQAWVYKPLYFGPNNSHTGRIQHAYSQGGIAIYDDDDIVADFSPGSMWLHGTEFGGPAIGFIDSSSSVWTTFGFDATENIIYFPTFRMNTDGKILFRDTSMYINSERYVGSGGIPVDYVMSLKSEKGFAFTGDATNTSFFFSVDGASDDGTISYNYTGGVFGTSTFYFQGGTIRAEAGITCADSTGMMRFTDGTSLACQIYSYQGEMRINPQIPLIISQEDIRLGAVNDMTPIVLSFYANDENTNGVLSWLAANDHFKFDDDIMMATGESIFFRDAAIYITSSDDGHLDLDADISIDLNANTGVTGTLDVSGELTATSGSDVYWNYGVTASRPDPDVGRRFFDEDLGQPIWGDGTAWVDATGSIV